LSGAAQKRQSSASFTFGRFCRIKKRLKAEQRNLSKNKNKGRIKFVSKIQLSILFAALLALLVSATYISTRSTAQTAQMAVRTDDYRLGATLWFQKAGEYRALALQSYALAKLRLDERLKKCKKLSKTMPCAIITDVDETILDNSPNQALMVKNHKSFNSNDWQQWCEMRSAKALPGAVDFFRYAAAKGVKTFYITNRETAQRAATLDNLKAAGFPEVTDETLMVRTDPNDATKEPRRNAVRQKYTVVMLLGDNLNDFSDIFERKSVAERFAAVESVRANFGSLFIVLPNPMYGDWENALYDYQRLSPEEKDARRLDSLQLY
jgi:5'-nucleotidase (lipoprotein e(P4) family)